MRYIHECPDETNPLFNAYIMRHGKDRDFRIWVIFLYSTCYCLGTALYLASKLDYRTLTKSELNEFWRDNKSKLLFQSDRRYAKNMDWFVPMVSEFMSRCKRHPYKYIQSFVRDTPEETYKALYEEIDSWRYYGRFSIILFLRVLVKLTDIRVDYDEYDWKNGATTVSGIWNAMYMDDKADQFDATNKLMPGDLDTLDEALKKLKRQMARRYPEDNHTILSITSDLCSYRKLYKGTRYVGYYVDRQQEEILTLQERFPGDALWEDLWQLRKAVLPNQYLGELNGWLGIRKDLCKSWIDRGAFS